MLIMLSIAFLISLTLVMFISTSSNNFTNGDKLSLFSFRIVVALCIFCSLKKSHSMLVTLSGSKSNQWPPEPGSCLPITFQTPGRVWTLLFSFFWAFILLTLSSHLSPYPLNVGDGHKCLLGELWDTNALFSKSMTKLSLCCLFGVIVTLDVEMPVIFLKMSETAPIITHCYNTKVTLHVLFCMLFLMEGNIYF
jgi:hypothetical protein